MTRIFRIGVLTLAITTLGCQHSSDSAIVTRSDNDATIAASNAVTQLLDEYQSLPEQQRQGLQGDQIIMQLDALLRARPGDSMPEAAAVVTEHNRKMLQRALADPDLIEITGTEEAPLPRER